MYVCVLSNVLEVHVGTSDCSGVEREVGAGTEDRGALIEDDEQLCGALDVEVISAARSGNGGALVEDDEDDDVDVGVLPGAFVK